MALTMAALSLVLAGPALATTMIYAPVEALFESSDRVVRGTVQSHTSLWGDGGQLFTDWTVQVDEVLYGAPVQQVTVRQMGGQMGDVSARIPGDAELAEGQHVVLFLVEEDGLHYLTALGQAVLQVSLQGDLPLPGGGTLERSHSTSEAVDDIQATLIRDLSDIAFFDPDQGEIVHLQNEILTLDQLRAMSPQAAPAEPTGGAQ